MNYQIRHAVIRQGSVLGLPPLAPAPVPLPARNLLARADPGRERSIRMTYQEAESTHATEPRTHRRATLAILFGLLVGVLGMLWAFSIPGAVLVLIAHLMGVS